jgi:hypothetical protein
MKCSNVEIVKKAFWQGGKQFGYQRTGGVFWKRGMSITSLVYVRRMTHMPAIQVRFGALPNVFIVDRLPRNEGQFGCVQDARCMFGEPFRDYFAKLADMSNPLRDLHDEDLSAAINDLYVWMEVHVVDEQRLRRDIIASESAFGNAVKVAMKEWALECLDPMKWPSLLCKA